MGQGRGGVAQESLGLDSFSRCEKFLWNILFYVENSSGSLHPTSFYFLTFFFKFNLFT